ncbi:unnamed protein product, partial [Polarella glacialis]
GTGNAGAGNGDSRHAGDDAPAYGVEYHAMDSDCEDGFAEPPKAAGNTQMICNVILGIFRAAVPSGSRSVNNNLLG